MEHKICSVANNLLWLRPSARREKKLGAICEKLRHAGITSFLLWCSFILNKINGSGDSLGATGRAALHK